MLWKLSGGDLSVANENQHYITDVPAVRIDRGAWFGGLEGQTFLIAESLDSCALLHAHGGGAFLLVRAPSSAGVPSVQRADVRAREDEPEGRGCHGAREAHGRRREDL